MAAFYERPRLIAAGAPCRASNFGLCATSGWPDNQGQQRLVAWTRRAADSRAVVVVNFPGVETAGYAHLPWAGPAAGERTFAGRSTGERFARSGQELAAAGLFVLPPPWGAHVLGC
jgi:hypothetical protein